MRAAHEARRGQRGDLHPIIDWSAKHEGRILRFAGLLHIAEHTDDVISWETMSRALRIGDYFLAHSMAALTVPDQLERRALLWLAARDEREVTVHNLHRGPLYGNGPVKDAEQLARRLVARGVLRPRPEAAQAKGRPGRPPSPSFAINPSIRRYLSAVPDGNGWGSFDADPLPGAYMPTDEDLHALVEEGAR
jgi:hypothetical protein